jgi:hypothetical protein
MTDEELQAIRDEVGRSRDVWGTLGFWEGNCYALLAEVDALKAESGRVAANYQDWPTLLVACSRCRRVIPVAEETGKVVNSPAYCSRHDCK